MGCGLSFGRLAAFFLGVLSEKGGGGNRRGGPVEKSDVEFRGKFRAVRRRVVKDLGKRLFRRIDAFFAAQSLIPTDPVLDRALFPWAEELESHWLAIRDELDRLLVHRDRFLAFQELSPDQKRISPDDKWKTFVLWGFG
ncbi:MAG: hypothetical protein KatS3mg076_1761 [Candidatus Binatia bacterium]|nr:MAG: hypothetical protein KatS3mg076_1761 [Candidatus Binatia bacterium]